MIMNILNEDEGSNLLNLLDSTQCDWYNQSFFYNVETEVILNIWTRYLIRPSSDQMKKSHRLNWPTYQMPRSWIRRKAYMAWPKLENCRSDFDGISGCQLWFYSSCLWGRIDGRRFHEEVKTQLEPWKTSHAIIQLIRKPIPTLLIICKTFISMNYTQKQIITYMHILLRHNTAWRKRDKSIKILNDVISKISNLPSNTFSSNLLRR